MIKQDECNISVEEQIKVNDNNTSLLKSMIASTTMENSMVSARTCSARIVLKVSSISVMAHVMFALSCIPKTSGSALRGRL